MDFRLDDDQRQLRDALRDFCDHEIAPKAAWRDENHRFEDDLVEKLAGMGLFGLYVPAEYGGAGLDYVSYAVAVEELSRACGATGILMSAHHSLCVDPILQFGTEAQKQKYLPKLASGEWIGCFSLTEPGSGSDAGAARCTATPRDGGWVLNGTKNFVTNGREAHVCVLFAVSEPEQSKSRRLSAFIVEKDTPGFTVGKLERKLGIRASSTAEFIFENCFIPADALLGERGKGLKVALATLDGGRIGVAAQAVGISQAALEAAVGYANTRQQFDRPLAAFEAIQFKIADMAAAVLPARLLTWRAAWLKQRYMTETDERRPASYEAEAAMAKLYASEMSSRVTQAAIQVFGGYGYCEDYPVERFMRDARITELYEGTSEIQRIVVARKVITEPEWLTR